MKRTISFAGKYIYALLSCVYLFAIGSISARNRRLISIICSHFLPPPKQARAPVRLNILPKIEPSSLILKDISIKIPEPDFINGNICLNETAIIAALVKRYDPATVFEIGTFDGKTTVNIIANCNRGAKIYTLDLVRKQMNSTKLPLHKFDKAYINKPVIGEAFLGTDHEKSIVQLTGDSATFDFAPYYGKMDFVFVDGSHSYEYVLNDSRKAIKLLSGKGIILWHDYSKSWEGVPRALHELYRTDTRFAGLKHIKTTDLALLARE